MVIVFVIIFLLCLYKMKISVKSGFNDYMSPQKTGAIKGVFVIFVLFSHMQKYVFFDRSLAANGAFYWIMSQIGQLMVVVFFFYSGYGIMQAVKKKKATYVKSMPKHRIFKTLLHFDIIVLIYVVVQYCVGKTFPIKQILLSLTGWSSVGNSAWFMFAIFVMYIVTYLVFLAAKERSVAAAAAITLIMVAYAALMWKIKGEKEYWFFDTVLCYPLGMWYALAKPRLDEKLLPSFKKWLIVSLSLVAVFTAMHIVYGSDHAKYRLLFIIEALILCVAIAIVSMRISVGNKALQWFGSKVFSIYIVQYIPMILLKYFGLTSYPYIFVGITFISVLAIATVLDRLTAKGDKLLKL